jgi:lysyl-tRNA synthetase class II
MQQVRIIREAETLKSQCPKKRLQATITGVITKVDNRGGVILMDIADSSGLIIAKLERDVLADNWDIIKLATVGNHVRISGEIVDHPKYLNNLILKVQKINIRAIPIKVSAKDEWSDVPERYFLACTRQGATRFFANKNFLEYETSYIFMKQPSPDMQPLQVVYQGLGASAWLSVSPMTQIKEILLRGGQPQVFSVARCFSAAPRDGFTTAESLVLCAAQTGVSFRDLLKLAQEAVRTILTSPILNPPTGGAWLDKNAVWPEKIISEGVLSSVVKQPTIGILRHGNDKSSQQSFHIIWPGTSCIAEGHVELLSEEGQPQPLFIGFLTIHIERILRIIHAKYRQILPYE